MREQNVASKLISNFQAKRESQKEPYLDEKLNVDVLRLGSITVLVARVAAARLDILALHAQGRSCEQREKCWGALLRGNICKIVTHMQMGCFKEA